MNRRPVGHVVRVLAVAGVAGVAALSHMARSDSTVPSRSLWTRATPKADMALTDPLTRRGQAVFDGHCRVCHGAAATPAGNGLFPGTYALQMRYQGKLPAALEQRRDLRADRVMAVVRRGGGGFMPPLRPTELSDADLQAVAAYLARRPTSP